jgi:hypothetical protein
MLSMFPEPGIADWQPQTANDIYHRLVLKYPAEQWLSFGELRIGTGYGKDAEQRLDFWTMHTYPSQRFRRIACEIKISRSDFLAELRRPEKRRRALLLSNEFYFVAPHGLIRVEELPPEAGLMETHLPGEGPTSIHVRVAAPWRDTPGPTWQFLASVVRRARTDK